ncbi:PEP-CTERM sorting domain-containing protein [Pontiella agarivorans]|uniref:PEP-CTERM sorting domain-containing protein n=1 Tax=Pontiella agarivorans TaxID=3038953 RepID=A0ABU5MUM7_9BACT|nr:PEP-CTERM sorting domain-containing protein [Pontiella agarivorans]MDZ8117920.1 PEP-CTERM sorting domain-containing protein [Pontiella agarivorans]
MKKAIVALVAVAMVGVANADIYANLSAGFGISGAGSAGGIVDAIDGTTVVLQVIDGGGDGLDYAAPGVIQYNGGLLTAGNDILLGTLTANVTGGGGDYSDWAATISGIVQYSYVSDAYFRVSGIEDGDWVYEGSAAFADIDTSDPKATPEFVFFDEGGAGGAADGSVTVQVIPEPATIGLMGIAGLGMFLARRKARR